MEARLQSDGTAWSSSTLTRYYTERVSVIDISKSANPFYKAVEDNPFTAAGILAQLEAQLVGENVLEKKVADLFEILARVSGDRLSLGELEHRLVERGNKPTIGSRKPDVIGYHSAADALLSCLPYLAFLGELKRPGANLEDNDTRGQTVNFASLLLQEEPFRESVMIFPTNGEKFELMCVKPPTPATTKVQTYVYQSVPFFPGAIPQQVCGLDVLWNLCSSTMSDLGSAALPAFASDAQYLGAGGSSIVFQHEDCAIKVPRRNHLMRDHDGVVLRDLLQHELSVYNVLAQAGCTLFLEASPLRMALQTRQGIDTDHTLLLKLKPVCRPVKPEHVTMKGVRYCLEQLRALHECGYVHLDMRRQNIMYCLNVATFW